MSHPLIGPFIFRDLGYLYQLVVPGQVPCVELTLPCRNFMLLPSCYIEWPSVSLVRWLPCIWITVMLRRIYVIKVVHCLLFFQGCLLYTESDQQAWYYSSFSIHSYPPQCGGKLSVPGSVASGVVPSPSGGFLPLGPSRGGPAGFSFYSMPALFHFGNSTASGGIGVECLQPSLDFSGKLCGSSSSSGPSCSVQVSSRTCQRSTQTFDSGGTMLDGGSLASHHSEHVG